MVSRGLTRCWWMGLGGGIGARESGSGGPGQGAEEGGGGAAGFDGVGVGLEDGFEGRDRGLAEGLIGLFAVEGDVGGDIGAGGPGVKGEEVVGGGELRGEGFEVLIQGEETQEHRGVGGAEGRESGLGLYGIHLVPYLYHTISGVQGVWERNSRFFEWAAGRLLPRLRAGTARRVWVGTGRGFVTGGPALCWYEQGRAELARYRGGAM